MPKKGTVFNNSDSKRRVTIQLRGYDMNGNYEEKSSDNPASIQVKNASDGEVLFGADSVNKQ